MAPASTQRWGDEADDEEEDYDQSSHSKPSSDNNNQSNSNIKIPPTHTSRVDSKGIKIVTSYRANPNSSNNSNSLLKTVTKIRVHTTTTKEHVHVAKRRQWKSFGQAAIDEAEKNTNVTIVSKDDIYLDDPNEDTDLQDEDVAKALTGNINAFWAKQQRRQLERKYDVEDVNQEEGKDNAPEIADGWQKVGEKSLTGGPPTGNKYVPPSARNASSASKGTGSLAAMASRLESNPNSSADANREQNTIRVTNISEATSEADLQDLFGKFGRISRVYVAKDKETKQSRGFAFVSFANQHEAQKAMEKLQGFGYDHLILKLEWARPSQPKDSGTQFRSGYGQALAQDTKEKVNFASNLTR